MSIARLAISILVATVFVALGGCAKSEPEQPKKIYVQESWFEDGPLRLHAAIDVNEIDVVGSVLLHFEAHVKPGHSLIPPEIGEKLGVFDVVDTKRTGPSMTETGETRWSLDVTIEPYLPGEHEVPALNFGYAPVPREDDGVGEQEGSGGEVVTRPIRVMVTSVLESDELALAELRDVIDPQTEFAFPTMGVVIGGVVAIGLVGGIVLIARKLQLEPVTPSPVTEALQRLQVLQMRTHDDADERQGTLSEVSELLRRCIAHRGDSRALRFSERELRRTMASWPGLDAHEHMRLLSLFKQLDEARFAGRAPGREETLDIVRDTIEMLPAIERTFVHFSIADAAEKDEEAALSAT